MSGQFLGDAPPNALISHQRIYGFLVAHRAVELMPEWRSVNQGLSTVASYHQVVSRLASLACQLAEAEPGPERSKMAGELIGLVVKLQQVSPEL